MDQSKVNNRLWKGGKMLFNYLNIVYGFEALAFLSTSALNTAYTDMFKYMGSSSPLVIDAMIIVLGSLLLLTSIFALSLWFFATIKRLHIYVGWQIFFIIFEISMVTMIVIFQPRIHAKSEALQERFRISLMNDNDAEYRNTLEKSLQCCGANGPEDYNGRSIPDACCPKFYRKGSSKYVIPLNHSYDECIDYYEFYRLGCIKKIEKPLRSFGEEMVIVCIIGSFAKIYSVIFAMLQAKKMREMDKAFSTKYGTTAKSST